MSWRTWGSHLWLLPPFQAALGVMGKRPAESRLRAGLPAPLWRWIFHFEAAIEAAVEDFAHQLPAGARVLDAGAGEGQYRRFFPKQSYCGIDLAVGDAAWNYSGLEVRGDLAALPFGNASFGAALNIVTLEHVTEPARVVCELARVLAPGGRLLLIAPQEWEEHQQPHDYFRYTRYGLQYLLQRAGFSGIDIRPVGGIFRLVGRRLLNAIQFLPLPLAIVLFLPLAVPGVLLPLLDILDTRRNFTLGYICYAHKES
ncbi:MAG TPA: class I SAM-dependent methyltransferase [Bryobacteraceae bacterium]|nr:class I SAM-dependent methyltransferase [Bryobacteraceae bacterium]